MISIESSASALAMALGDMRGKEIPFATQRALNEVAFKAQRAERAELPRVLELRNRFSETGIQVEKADKDDWPTTFARVGVEERRSYLLDHITGGKRAGGAHGRAILGQDSLRSKTGKVPSAKRPAALIATAKRADRQAELTRTFGGKRGRDKRLPFLFHSRKWGNEVIARRMGKGRYPLLFVYAFRKGVTIRREFEFDKIAQLEVGATYHQAFNKALRRAIASGKGKGERGASRSRDHRTDTGR